MEKSVIVGVRSHTDSEGSVESTRPSPDTLSGGLTGVAQPVMVDRLVSVSAVGRGRGRCCDLDQISLFPLGVEVVDA